jgi:lysozyme family protein
VITRLLLVVLIILGITIMATHTYAKYKPGYDELLASVVVKPQWKSGVDRVAKQILANKDRYMEVENAIGVPWQFVGVVHSLECGLSFAGHLHNGDPLTKRTRLVPKGYPKHKPSGPNGYTWLESAIDALKLKDLDKLNDWSDSRVAFELERYNGWGYRSKGKPNSPYLWSGSNHYTRGKYIRDHVYDSNAVSQQIGAMLIYLRVKELDQVKTPTLQKEEVKVLKKTSKGFWLTRNLREFFRWFAGAIAGLFTLDFWGFAKDFMTALKDFAFSPKGVLVLAGVLLIVWLMVEYLDHRKRKDVAEGRHIPSGEGAEHVDSAN